MAGVTVCICTYRRPEGLARALIELERLQWDAPLRVVIVDNDAGREGLEICARMAAGYRWALEFAHEPVAGISHARNRAVGIALRHDTDFIAMIDDDEWPSPVWLRELMQISALEDADIVGGPVMPVFPGEVEPWVEAAIDCYGADQQLENGASCLLYACGNFMARSECFRSVAPHCFDPGFAHSGGEDLEFFRRLDTIGYRMRWSTKAIVYEQVGRDRMNLQWLRNRMLIKGNATTRVFRLHSPGLFHDGWRLSKTAGLVTVGTLKYLFGAVHQPSRIRGRMMLWQAQGKILAFLGDTVIRPEQHEGERG